MVGSNKDLISYQVNVFYAIFTMMTMLCLLFYYELMPSVELICYQSFAAICFYSHFAFFKRLNIRAIYVGIGIYQLIFVIILRVFVLDKFGSPFGPNPIDSQLYHDLGVSGVNMSQKEYIGWIKAMGYDFSDFGFPVIVRWVYNFFGDWGVNTLVLINVIVHILTVRYTYKLSLLLNCNYANAKLIAIIWGLSSCATWLSISGLKEIIFIFIIVFTMYNLYLYISNKNIAKLLLFFLGCFLILFFRYYLSIFFIVIFSIYYISSKRWYRNVYPIAFMSICLFLILSLTSLAFIFPEFEAVDELYERRIGGNTSSLTKTAYSILSFVAPFPSITAKEAVQNLFFSTFSLVKVAISGLFIYQMVWIFFKKDNFYYPILSFIILDIILCITTSFYGNYRYLLPMMPFYFIVAAVGAQKAPFWNYYKYYNLIYIIFVTLVIWFNNSKEL